jgi:hypothetical protein
MYYQDLTSVPGWQRRMAVTQWKAMGLLEPRLLESLAVLGYRLTRGEHLWIPRLLSSVFWVLGSIPLYLLAKALVDENGGLVTAAFYLFLPYGVVASRSFLPEPLMTAALALAFWGLYQWYLVKSWQRALLAGVLSCGVIFVKPVIALPVLGAMAGLFLGGLGFKQAFRNAQAWCIFLITTLPYLAYYIYGTRIAGILATTLDGRFFPELLVSPWFYLRWELKINQVMGHVFLAAGLFGLLFFKSRAIRWFGVGLWVGYGLYGMLFNYQASTHDYYHIPLIPIVSLSLGALASWAAGRLLQIKNHQKKMTWALGGLLLLAVGVFVWRADYLMRSVDYRPQVKLYERLGNLIDRKKKVIALTEDYGYRLSYWGWMTPIVWPSIGDLQYSRKRGHEPDEFSKMFSSLTSKMDYFIVTWFDELDLQPELRDHLEQNYPVYAEGPGYRIYSLR